MKKSIICTHYGENDKEKFLHSVVPPVYETVNFSFSSFQEVQEYFSEDNNARYYYTRKLNPTVEVLERKIAALENTPSCKLFASGMGAIAAGIRGLANQGDHIISVRTVYKNTYRILEEITPRYGIQTTFVEGSKIEDYEKALKKNTKLIFLESPTSYKYALQDLKAIAQFAKKNNIITLIDSTNATPINQNPYNLGIDVVIHSCSKYMNGHGDVLAGAVCASEEIIGKIAEREHYLSGNLLHPHSAWLVLRGLRTFATRMEYHNKAGIEIAKFFEDHHDVSRVYYPYLSSHPQYELAQKQMRGAGSLMGVEFKLKPDEIAKFIDKLKYFNIAASWGGFESLVWYPMFGVNNTDSKWLEEHCLSPNMVRFYIGLENIAELKNDIEQALKECRR